METKPSHNDSVWRTYWEMQLPILALLRNVSMRLIAIAVSLIILVFGARFAHADEVSYDEYTIDSIEITDEAIVEHPAPAHVMPLPMPVMTTLLFPHVVLGPSTPGFPVNVAHPVDVAHAVTVAHPVDPGFAVDVAHAVTVGQAAQFASASLFSVGRAVTIGTATPVGHSVSVGHAVTIAHAVDVGTPDLASHEIAIDSGHHATSTEAVLAQLKRQLDAYNAN